MVNPTLTAYQCRTARAALGWTQQKLATESGIGSTSVKKFELGAPLHHALVGILRLTFEKAGVMFLDAGTLHEGHRVRLGVILKDG